MNNSEEKYYVYIYLDPLIPGEVVYGDFSFEAEPFFVGKGSSKARKRSHLFESQSRKDPNSHKINRIRSIQRQGQQPIILEIFHSDLENEAYRIESELIQLIGRRDQNKGPLTLSGENNWITGIGHSQETKELMSRKKKEFLAKNVHPRLGKTSPVAGKTYEELYGIEGAYTRRLLQRENAIKKGLGKVGRSSKSYSEDERKAKAKNLMVPITIRGKSYSSIGEAVIDLGLSRYLIGKELKKEKEDGLENS